MIDFFNKITILGIDSNIKNLTIAFRKQYKFRLPDAIIAATPKSLNATLFTNDVKLVNLTEINTQSMQIV
ncbi:PIN domain-containing protein [Nostoc sp.]|uniref:PIN domain-containing protein n=1 Tax=Nostoc sp. TaxID=1180 RepID=UPI002FF4B371